VEFKDEPSNLHSLAQGKQNGRPQVVWVWWAKGVSGSGDFRSGMISSHGADGDGGEPAMDGFSGLVWPGLSSIYRGVSLFRFVWFRFPLSSFFLCLDTMYPTKRSPESE
jgi:hypothetical protein